MYVGIPQFLCMYCMYVCGGLTDFASVLVTTEKAFPKAAICLGEMGSRLGLLPLPIYRY